jgi:hypothetical protein
MNLVMIETRQCFLFQQISDTLGHLGLFLGGFGVYLPIERQMISMGRHALDQRVTQCEDTMSQKL